MAEEVKEWTIPDAMKKLESLIPEVTKRILLTDNAVWNREQAGMLRGMTGALIDLQMYQSRKFGPKK